MKILAMTGLLIFLMACAAKPISSGAERIKISRALPAKGCHYLGEVHGSQGNFWTAEFTSDKRLIEGARNELRSSALLLGANFVEIVTESNSHNTANHSLGGTYASVLIGNAYRCPESSNTT